MRAAALLPLLRAAAAYELGDTAALSHVAGVVNAQKAGWTADPAAGGQFKTLAGVKTLCGTWLKGDPQYQEIRLPEYKGAVGDVPAEFDARTQWPKCTVISKVRNQAGCGSCWAFGATESFESRRCVATGEDVEFSAGDTSACSGFLGNGCSGGQPAAAARWFANTGVVTGGEYHEDNGCVPYDCPPCKKGLYPPTKDQPDGCPTSECGSQLKCHKDCTNANYNKTYGADKTKAAKAISVGRSVATIQQALVTDGPLAVGFTVYDDFPTYKSGVYHHTSGSQLGGHAVMLLGYGTEDGQDYWLLKNSWTDAWGNKGYAKVRRGNNECGVEASVSATQFS